MSFSVLILTLNEVDNLEACLDSVAFCDDVVVLDSGSEDGTIALAESRGIRVVHRAFDNFADHRNWALANVEFKYGHVFHLDADERFTPELELECRAIVEEDRRSGYLVSSKLMFMGKWIRHASQFPCYQMRFLKLGESEFAANGHGQTDGRLDRGLGTLKNAYLHFNFSKGLEDWIEKHNRYSSGEAAACPSKPSLSELVSGPAYSRRKALKAFASHLPCQPTLRFLYLYVVRGGFLDGAAGYHYCRLIAQYQYWIVLKARWGQWQ